jgi:hypothetical protein
MACSIAVAISPVCLWADDTGAQAMARAALQQKMREMGSQGPAAVTPAETPALKVAQIQQTPPPEATPPTQKQAPHPVLTPAPRRSSIGQPPVVPSYMPTLIDSAKAQGSPLTNAITLIAAPPASKPDVIEQARRATRAKVAELNGQPQAATPVFQPTQETPAPATQPAATAVKPTGPSKEEIRAAKEREAAEKKAAQQKAEMEKAAAKKAAADKAAADKAAAQQAKMAADQEKAAAAKAAKMKNEKHEAAPVTFTPMTAPPSSLPPTKDQRLQTLLDQYKADKLTAEEYHDQRAKIIAEP